MTLNDYCLYEELGAGSRETINNKEYFIINMEADIYKKGFQGNILKNKDMCVFIKNEDNNLDLIAEFGNIDYYDVVKKIEAENFKEKGDNKMEKKYYVVAGYIDQNIYKNLEDTRPLVNPKIYSLSEALNLFYNNSFEEYLKEQYDEEKAFELYHERANDEILIKELEHYNEGDEILSIAVFDDKEEAERNLQNQLEKIKDISDSYEYEYIKENESGIFVKVFKEKD